MIDNIDIVYNKYYYKTNNHIKPTWKLDCMCLNPAIIRSINLLNLEYNTNKAKWESTVVLWQKKKKEISTAVISKKKNWIYVGLLYHHTFTYVSKTHNTYHNKIITGTCSLVACMCMYLCVLLYFNNYIVVVEDHYFYCCIKKWVDMGIQALHF